MKISDIIPLNEVSRPPNIEDAIPILREAGWKRVGEGYYAAVYGRADKDYVLKLFDYRDRGYAEFLKLIKQHPNIHFPRIIGKPIKVTDKYWAVRMEKLIPCKNRVSLSVYIISLSAKGINQRNEYQVEAFARTQEYLANHPEMKVALDLIDEHLLDRFREDLHEENVMQRADGTLVIIDPVAY